MKKSFLLMLCCISFLFSDEITLKPGWNLVGIPSEDSASVLTNILNISKSTGGGVGNSNNFVYLKDLNFSRGDFLLGQGYWIKLEGNDNKVFEYTKVTDIPSQLVLKSGWNLVYPFRTLKASDLSKYPEIEKATGGGVGNTNNFVYLKEINFSRGESLEGQGYWIKVADEVDEVILNFIDFDYRVWGIGGDSSSSMSTLRVNGIPYTIFIYSTHNVEQSNSSISGEFTLFKGSINNKDVPILQINDDYLNKDVKIKIFNENTIVSQSNIFIPNNGVIDYENIIIENKDDFSVPFLKDNLKNELTPPLSPTF